MKFFSKNSKPTQSTPSTTKLKDEITNKVTNFQNRLASESETILNEKLSKKIGDLDEICCQEDLWSIKRIPEIRAITKAALEGYFEACEAQQEGGEEGGQNSFLQMLMGGGASASAEKEEEGAEVAGSPSKMLLNQIKLTEDNKISFKISLELDNKNKNAKDKASEKAEKEEANEPKSEAKQTEAEAEEPPAKKAKSSSSMKDDESEEKSENVEKGEKSEKEEKQKEEPPTLASHPAILELATIIRPQIDEIVDWCVTLRAWLLTTLQRNKNMGGADLNAEAKAVIIEEIKGIEDEFTAYKEQISGYFLTKATILEKYVKAPELEDLKNFILDEDEKMFVQCRNIVMALRNQTMSLYDAIEKDSDRLFSENYDGGSVNFGMY